MPRHDPPETVSQPTAAASGAVAPAVVRVADRGRLVNGAAVWHILARDVRNFSDCTASLGPAKNPDHLHARGGALGVTTAT